jgi:hypothetical protein
MIQYSEEVLSQWWSGEWDSRIQEKKKVQQVCDFLFTRRIIRTTRK